jgi:DeoR/GlpR family transcriptional regulator of sugar metabolism
MRSVRRSRIEALINTHGGCSVDTLAQECGVSGMTIRRDLAALARAGKLVRTHGGALPGDRVFFEFEFLKHSRVHDVAKRQIGITAGALIPDGSTVMMDSGTTTLALATELRHRHGLTIITSSLPIAATLQRAPGLQVLLLGGMVRKDSPDLIGAITEANLESLRADLAFIGADAIDLKGAIYNQSPEVARTLSKMAAAAGRVYGVADHSKIAHTALARFGQLSQWCGLITDVGLSAAHQEALRKAGVNLILAGKAHNVEPIQ